MQRGLLHEQAQIEKYSDLILTHCEQLTEMIEGVLVFAGAQRSGAAVVRRPVELMDVLNEAVTATAHDVSAANCVVHMELPPALPAVTGDAAALRRVFQNLITNAAKHAGEGGWIGVAAVVDNDAGKVPMVEIEIADRGPGIPEEELSEIFKPFFRGVNATQSRGSGLGLSLVREIVEAHKGSVSVRSHNGQGTIFTVRLPAVLEKSK
jgi:signal transduction histidine kinase